MMEKQALEKLRILLPHWIEHNQSHAAEFRRWSATARDQGLSEVATLIARAADIVAEVDRLLAEASAKTGVLAHHHGGQQHHHHD